jgi:DNA (cytosine-5)-methyltransferase 1
MMEDMSDRQLYKQAGNGVTVTVIEAIGRNLREADAGLSREDSADAD